MKAKISEDFCLKSQDCRPILPVFLGNGLHTLNLCELYENAYKKLVPPFHTLSYKNTALLLLHSLSFFFGCLWCCSIFTRFFLQEFSHRATPEISFKVLPKILSLARLSVQLTQDVTGISNKSCLPCVNQTASMTQSWSKCAFL